MSLTRIINELIVENVQESIKFYEDNFKFKTDITEGEPITWAQLKKDGVIMLENYDIVKKSINNYPSKVNNSNSETDYGKAEFGNFDLDKNMILISALI